jgi:hypothetical protein
MTNVQQQFYTNNIDGLSNIISNNERTDNNKLDKYENSTEYNKQNSSSNTDINFINIYRYKFTDEFTSELYKFSKIHQYDHRKDFKEAWALWIEENDDIVSKEIRRLTELSYEGDILDKMFKSARYYFRKKSTEKKAPKERRDYVSVSKTFLEIIDNHVKKNINNPDFKPSSSFDAFCKEHIGVLGEEVKLLCKNGLTDSQEIKDKIKKTYKNRYSVIISK